MNESATTTTEAKVFGKAFYTGEGRRVITVEDALEMIARLELEIEQQRQALDTLGFKLSALDEQVQNYEGEL